MPCRKYSVFVSKSCYYPVLVPATLDTVYFTVQQFCLISRNSGKSVFCHTENLCEWSRNSGPGVFHHPTLDYGRYSVFISKIIQVFCARSRNSGDGVLFHPTAILCEFQKFWNICLLRHTDNLCVWSRNSGPPYTGTEDILCLFPKTYRYSVFLPESLDTVYLSTSSYSNFV
jgi:hypothetical protein